MILPQSPNPKTCLCNENYENSRDNFNEGIGYGHSSQQPSQALSTNPKIAKFSKTPKC
jgi:hypothetical protein